jgi:hypothetical protein
VVNGKRAISKAQAKALGEFFNVNPGVFIWLTRRPRGTREKSAIETATRQTFVPADGD